ncbi:DUF3526 domain-containing protein [Reichenbachiella agarivorans]|uniref:DUF3526 domain-containing protein n=1 Tax=Reichenbachiella agarivorans TaxID=2979464 RepID=A0ABY6CJT7_9BACT|nr:DUF3526 domain-containing protein [Reichenbachiella agarivorans]UXP30786.1 DUF3526 domain-containing protein [Reichenbachiella agarivorans]
MFSLIAKQFIRSKTVIFIFVLILIMGITSILIGKQFLAKQEKTIAQVTRQQEEHIERNVAYHEDEFGLLMYYLRFALINKPDKLSALSIGQRDINPSLQSVTIRNLEGQKYDTDLNNPANLQSGNLDFGFVIIYLFPLLIIAFTFNLLSEENETGTWRLIAIQSKSKIRFLWYKLSIRALMIYASLAILFAIAILALSLELNGSLAQFIVLSVLYLTFWFVLCFWVVSFQRNSSFNLLTLLSLWVVLAILLPATINNFLANKYPVPEALSTMVKQRDGYHKKWDMDKQETIEKFYAHYPQYKNYTDTTEGFGWMWYYAMQQMGDDESLEQSNAMREKLMQREHASRLIALAIPTMYTQLLFNDIANTSLGDHLAFQDKTNEFHEKTRLYFYPKIFENRPVKSEDWSQFKPKYFSKNTDSHPLKLIWPLISIITIMFAGIMMNTRKI